MELKWVLDLALLAAIFLWFGSLFLLIHWFVAPKLVPFYFESISPWLHPRVKTLAIATWNNAVATSRFLYTKTSELIQKLRQKSN